MLLLQARQTQSCRAFASKNINVAINSALKQKLKKIADRGVAAERNSLIMRLP